MPKANMSLENLPTQFMLCVKSVTSQNKLLRKYSDRKCNVRVTRGENVEAVTQSDILILGCKPHMVENVLGEDGVREALKGKLLVSIAAGWTRKQLEFLLYGSETTSDNVSERCWIVRAMPNTAAVVSESATAIETSEPHLPQRYSNMVDAIFKSVGKVFHLPASQMDVSTAVGSTPAFFAIICDALIDGAVAMGLLRQDANDMIVQAMRGSAGMLQAGDSTTSLKEKVTSPGGCTIGAIMQLEEAGLRGIMSKAFRESTTIATLLGQGISNVNGTRHLRQ